MTERKDQRLAGDLSEAGRNDLKCSWLRTWTAALKTLLGWPEERTLEWAYRTYGEILNSQDPSTLISFNHDRPELYIGFLLIRELRVGAPGGQERSVIARRLAFAGIQTPGNDKRAWEFDDDDWAAARERVVAILKDYGADLPA